MTVKQNTLDVKMQLTPSFLNAAQKELQDNDKKREALSELALKTIDSMKTILSETDSATVARRVKEVFVDVSISNSWSIVTGTGPVRLTDLQKACVRCFNELQEINGKIEKINDREKVLTAIINSDIEECDFDPCS